MKMFIRISCGPFLFAVGKPDTRPPVSACRARKENFPPMSDKKQSAPGERPRRPRGQARPEGGREPRIPYDSERTRRPRDPEGGREPRAPYDPDRPRRQHEPARPDGGRDFGTPFDGGRDFGTPFDRERPRGLRSDDGPEGEQRVGPAFDAERPRGAAGALIELDLELMKLLVRRAKLVSRVRGGKSHASDPKAILAEKAVRAAFERNAATFSKDPRFTRKLFDLLQDLQVLSREESENEPGFHLAPPKKPVRIALAAPAHPGAAVLRAALAAFSGRPARLERVPSARGLIQTLKGLAAPGAPAVWHDQSPSVGAFDLAAGPAVSFAGKSLHAADSLLALCLILFAAVPETGVCRLTGGSALKDADLSFLRRILPTLGARMAHVMPRSTGLPASLECSGILPDRLELTEDLPAPALCALLAAPLLWNRAFVLDFSGVPAATRESALALLRPVFAENAALVRLEGATALYSPGATVVPECPALPADPLVCAHIAALAVPVGGEARILGPWPDAPEAIAALALLKSFGLEAEPGPEGVAFRMGAAPTGPVAAPNLPDLLPLWAGLRDRERDPLPEDAARSALVEEFNEHVRPADTAAPLVPWVCPDAFWGMAFALAAFARPGLRLVNPALVAGVAPVFWPLFNGLPVPNDPTQPVAAKEKPHDAPVRRRVLAD